MRVAFIAAHAIVNRVSRRLAAAARIPADASVTFRRGPWCIDVAGSGDCVKRIVLADGGECSAWSSRIVRGALLTVVVSYGGDGGAFDEVTILLTADEVTGAAAEAMVRRADGENDE